MFEVSLNPWESDWQSLAMQMLRIVAQAPTPSVEFDIDWAALAKVDQAGDHLKVVEAEWKEDIELLIRWLAKDGQAHSTASEPVSFLALRASVLLRYLMGLTLRSDSPDTGPRRPITPFPYLPPSEVFSLFMIDWWNEHGYYYAGAEKMIEQIADALKKR